MSSQTSEKVFESYVEEILMHSSGWKDGDKKEWNQELALFPTEVLRFLRATQPRLWSQMEKLHGTELEPKVIQALTKELETKGSLQVLRQGFKFYGKTFKLAYFQPAHGLNPEVQALYDENRLRVTRQVPCHPEDESTIDLLFSLNGLPVATCELKNPNTGQTCKHAIQQYKTDRDPLAPLFSFKKRALVHFAVDPDEAYYTTYLKRDKTVFLPFNRGSAPGQVQCGAGNPEHASGYRTAYLWEEVLQRDSFLDILGHYLFLEQAKEKHKSKNGRIKTVTKEKLVFPRYHQLDAVRKLVDSSQSQGAGHNYLIQHSAGSGKTNSISWLAHHLASLHDEVDKKVYDCVVVISDRQVIDQQLQDAIYQIDHAQGVVRPIDENSQQLARALVDGTKIVVSTLQKFPFILQALLKDISDGNYEDMKAEEQAKVQEQAAEYQSKISTRNYAVIVDEAHSSQTGETARELKEILGSGMEVEEGETFGDQLDKIMGSRGPQKNLSFYAFTATPKGKTLELFGSPGPNGKAMPSHIYSMRQAIEEGFILDVLRNYTTYQTFYRLVKEAEEDPEVLKKKASRSLARFLKLHPYNVEQKTQVMVEHFRKQIQPKLNGKAKAMVVADSRLQAVRYMNAFRRYIKEQGYSDITPLVAFSGTVKDPDDQSEYTEPGMNRDSTGISISESQLPEHFDTEDNCRILLVANKYQTGFDQPLLQAMYVDKRLEGIQAVQTLSRLNRNYPGKKEPFVLDFANEPEGIYASFKPYYDATSLQEASDPAQLEAIKVELDDMQVYYTSEVEAFADIFYKPLHKQNKGEHARLEKQLQPAVDRFKQLEEDEQQLFRDKLRGFVNLYAFLSQVLPYTDEEHEKRYSFGRYLLPHLPTLRDEQSVNPENDVDLQYYRLERVSSGTIDLKTGDLEEVKSLTEVGSGKEAEDKAPLSDIIELLNDRFGTEFNEEDRLFFEQIKQRASQNEEVIQTAQANTYDKFELGIQKMVEGFMMQLMSNNDKIVTKYMEDQEFQNTVFPRLAEEIYRNVKGEGN